MVGDGNVVGGVELTHSSTNEITNLKVDGVFIAIGHKPNTDLFQKQLNMENGYIVTEYARDGNFTQTSIPGIFAAGDVQDHVYRQAITSAATVVARIKKSKIIDNANISSGDVIIGLESFGKANYESSYNGGIGSNGLTSARHDVFNKKLKEDLDSRVIIYTGKGDNFSAGADLKEKRESKSYLELWRNNFGKPAIESMLNVDQITIAAVNGYCLGGAACIASACDFRIADTNSKLGYPEIDLGINLN